MSLFFDTSDFYVAVLRLGLVCETQLLQERPK